MLQQARSVLQKAEELVEGARQSDYGHPLDNWSKTAQIWSAILGFPISAEQALLCMIGVKLVREAHMPKEDNLVDIAGYVKCLEIVINESEVRATHRASSAKT